MTIGYTHGRFQPLHKGHMKLFKNIYVEYDELWIGIANPLRRMPELLHLLDTSTQENLKLRRRPENNFIPYVDIVFMLDAALRAEGFDMSRIKILPHFSHYDIANWQDYIPKRAVIIKSIQKDYHQSKQSVFENCGWKVEHFKEEFDYYKNFLSAWPNGDWQQHVPKSIIARLTSFSKG